MSASQKALLAVGTVAVLAISFAVLQPGSGDDDDAGTAAAPAAATTPRTVGTTAPSADGTTAPTATAPAAPAEPATTLIRVRGGQPVGGVKNIEVEQGDRIRFTVSSDQSDEVHVHGYDLEKPVAPGAPARFSFTADADGIFEVELHGSENQIASLEVQPR